MLYVNKPLSALSRDNGAAGLQLAQPSRLNRVLSAGLRQAGLALFCGIVGVGCAGVYWLGAVPEFRATAQLLLNDGETVLDDPIIESQIAILQSGSTASAVIDRLGLAERPAFSNPPQAPWAGLGAGLGRMVGPVVHGPLTRSVAVVQERTGYAPAWSDRLDGLVNPVVNAAPSAEARFLDSLQVSRRDGGYVLDVSVMSASATLAAEIANDVAVYHSEGRWRGLDPAPERVAVPNLAAYGAETERARARLAASVEEEAALRRVLDEPDAPVPSSVMDDVPTLQPLVESRQAAARRASEITERYSASHIAAIRLRAQVDSFDEDIAALMAGRIETIAAERESAEAALAASETALATANSRAQELQAADDDAATASSSTLLTRATVPTSPVSPVLERTLLGGGLLGLAFGVVLGAFRESRDRGFTSQESVRQALALDCLGLIGRIPKRRLGKADNSGGRGKAVSQQPALPPTEIMVDERRVIDVRDTALRFALDKPMSSASETLRAVKLAVDIQTIGEKSRSIGLVSALPGEGKSTIAANLAASIAATGKTVLLLDADLRNPSLTRALAPASNEGLVDVLNDISRFDTALYQERQSGYMFLPSPPRPDAAQSGAILGSSAMRAVMDQLAATFDYVIVDLPPLGPLVDTKVMATELDRLVLVTEWSGPPKSAVARILSGAPAVWDKTAGVVLNKVPRRALERNLVPGVARNYVKSFQKYYSEKG